MSRPITDAGVAAVLAAFDRQAASPWRDDSVLGGFLTIVTDIDADFDGWEDDDLRAVLTAFAVHAPDEELDGMVERARGENEWIVKYEEERAADARQTEQRELAREAAHN